MTITLGIDASRIRSGGGKAHLIGVLLEGDPLKHGIKEVHVWSYRVLLDSIPDRPWLIKHAPKILEKSIFHQLWWQRFIFPHEAREVGCSIVFNVDAGTISPFRPSVTLSQDMASYEPGVIKNYRFGRTKIRIMLLRYIQNLSLSKASGAIFLTQYASDVIQRHCGKLKRVAIIPHGIGGDFKNIEKKSSCKDQKDIMNILYVSPVWEFKHQWVVVKAIELLRSRGYKVTLSLVGGGNRQSQQKLERQIAISDPQRKFVKQYGAVRHSEILSFLSNAEIFIFASSCENLPNTLIEAMAAGLPIACSDRGPMPEILKDGGVYFDPENHESVARAIEKLITDKELRQQVAERAKMLSGEYSWARCANETFGFVVDCYKGFAGKG